MNNMTETDSVNFVLPKRTLESVAGKLAKAYHQETGNEYSIPIIRSAISAWLDKHFDSITAQLDDLISPGGPDAFEFQRHLERAVRDMTRNLHTGAVPIEAEVNVFNGNRMFSFEKLAAMTAYIADKGNSIYKTKLNKLLFYADFVNYYLHGQSISGARYVHLPYGPVPDRYENLLEDLSAYGAIQIVKSQTFELIQSGEKADATNLTHYESRTLDWVLDNYGKLSTTEISELSHREKAYRFTRPGEEIAYEYAKFFETLPSDK